MRLIFCFFLIVALCVGQPSRLIEIISCLLNPFNAATFPSAMEKWGLSAANLKPSPPGSVL